MNQLTINKIRMSLVAVSLAGFALGAQAQTYSTPEARNPNLSAAPGSTTLNNPDSAWTNDRYTAYRSARKECDGRQGAMRDSCWSDVDARYSVTNASKIRCDALTGAVRADCLKNTNAGQ